MFIILSLFVVVNFMLRNKRSLYKALDNSVIDIIRDVHGSRLNSGKIAHINKRGREGVLYAGYLAPVDVGSNRDKNYVDILPNINFVYKIAKGDVLQSLLVSRLAPNGRGSEVILQLRGQKTYSIYNFPNMIPGDLYSFVILEKSNDIGYLEAVEKVSQSPVATQIQCEHFETGLCSGCHFIGLKDDVQNKEKSRLLHVLLNDTGGMNDVLKPFLNGQLSVNLFPNGLNQLSKRHAYNEHQKKLQKREMKSSGLIGNVASTPKVLPEDRTTSAFRLTTKNEEKRFLSFSQNKEELVDMMLPDMFESVDTEESMPSITTGPFVESSYQSTYRHKDFMSFVFDVTGALSLYSTQDDKITSIYPTTNSTCLVANLTVDRVAKFLSTFIISNRSALDLVNSANISGSLYEVGILTNEEKAIVTFEFSKHHDGLSKIFETLCLIFKQNTENIQFTCSFVNVENFKMTNKFTLEKLHNASINTNRSDEYKIIDYDVDSKSGNHRRFVRNIEELDKYSEKPIGSAKNINDNKSRNHLNIYSLDHDEFAEEAYVAPHRSIDYQERFNLRKIFDEKKKITNESPEGKFVESHLSMNHGIFHLGQPRGELIQHISLKKSVAEPSIFPSKQNPVSSLSKSYTQISWKQPSLKIKTITSEPRNKYKPLSDPNLIIEEIPFLPFTIQPEEILFKSLKSPLSHFQYINNNCLSKYLSLIYESFESDDNLPEDITSVNVFDFFSGVGNFSIFTLLYLKSKYPKIQKFRIYSFDINPLDLLLTRKIGKMNNLNLKTPTDDNILTDIISFKNYTNFAQKQAPSLNKIFTHLSRNPLDLKYIPISIDLCHNDSLVSLSIFIQNVYKMHMDLDDQKSIHISLCHYGKMQVLNNHALFENVDFKFSKFIKWLSNTMRPISSRLFIFGNEQEDVINCIHEVTRKYEKKDENTSKDESNNDKSEEIRNKSVIWNSILHEAPPDSKFKFKNLDEINDRAKTLRDRTDSRHKFKSFLNSGKYYDPYRVVNFKVFDTSPHVYNLDIMAYLKRDIQ